MKTAREKLLEDNTRPRRIPVSSNRDILTVKRIPKDKVSRWVNDKEDRLFKFLQGGWEFVTDEGTVVGEKTVDASRGVGTVVHRQVGGGVTAYLMVIDRELYEEDQLAKQDNVDEKEADLYREMKSKNYYGDIKSER